jgi:TolB-like protein
MKAIAQLFFAACLLATVALPGAAEGPILFEDHFDDNRNGWYLGDQDALRLAIEGGRYIIGVKSAGGWACATTPLGVDDRTDFSMEYTCQKLDGENDYGYGLVWGMKDTSNFFLFAVTGKGAFLVEKLEGGQWQHLVSYTNSAAINKYNAKNTIKIARIGRRLELYINDVFVKKLPFEPFFDHFAGFAVFNVKNVAFDDFLVKELKRDNRDRAKRRVTVLELASPGGDCDKATRLSLSESLMASLRDMGDFDVLESLDIDKVLKEQERQLGDAMDPATAARIGQLQNAQAIVIGSVVRVGDAWVAQARLVDVETGKILGAGKVTADSLRSLSESMDRLTGSLEE